MTQTSSRSTGTVADVLCGLAKADEHPKRKDGSHIHVNPGTEGLLAAGLSVTPQVYRYLRARATPGEMGPMRNALRGAWHGIGTRRGIGIGAGMAAYNAETENPHNHETGPERVLGAAGVGGGAYAVTHMLQRIAHRSQFIADSMKRR